MNARISISYGDLDDPDIQDLLAAHLAFASESSPAGSGHALDLAALKRQGLTFWAARAGGADTLGCVALKDLGGGVGEVKSLHVRAAARGRGIARALMAALEAETRARGIKTLKLETGSNDAFAPSRALYTRLGFRACAKFGDYVSDDFSFCMEKRL